MQIILLEKVANLGNLGDVVKITVYVTDDKFRNEIAANCNTRHRENLPVGFAPHALDAPGHDFSATFHHPAFDGLGSYAPGAARPPGTSLVLARAADRQGPVSGTA